MGRRGEDGKGRRLSTGPAAAGDPNTGRPIPLTCCLFIIMNRSGFLGALEAQDEKDVNSLLAGHWVENSASLHQEHEVMKYENCFSC